jgi:hypothetical protein
MFNNAFYIILATIFVIVAGFAFFLMYPNRGMRMHLKIEFFVVLLLSFAPFLFLTYLNQKAAEESYIAFNVPAKEFSIWKAVGYQVIWPIHFVFILINNEYVVTRLKMVKDLNEFESRILREKDIAWQRLMSLILIVFMFGLLVSAMNQPYFSVSYRYQGTLPQQNSFEPIPQPQP